MHGASTSDQVHTGSMLQSTSAVPAPGLTKPKPDDSMLCYLSWIYINLLEN
jgi:hypothetical protein